MFSTIRESKPCIVSLDGQKFWDPATAAYSVHSKQKNKQPIPIPTPAIKLQGDSSLGVRIDLNRLPAVSGYRFDKLKTDPSNAAHINAERNEDAEGTLHNKQEADSSQSVDMPLLVDAVTTPSLKTPPAETKSFKSIVEKVLQSPSLVFDNVDQTGEPGWTDLFTINQASEEAAITSNRLAKHLSMPPPTPPASGLSEADKASQNIMESIVHSVNCLPISNTPAQIDNIPEASSASSSIQQSPGSSAEQRIDTSGDGPYCVGSEPCQSTIKPLQRTEDSYIPSSPNQSGYGHSFPYDDMSGVGGEDDDDDSNNGDDSSYAHNDAQGYETSSSEKEAADYDGERSARKRGRIAQSLGANTPSCAINDIIHCETSCGKEDAADYDSDQPPRKRVKGRRSLAVAANTSSRACTPRFPASTELVKQMGKIIPSSSMLSLASSLAQGSSNNEDSGAADAIIYEEIPVLGTLSFSSVDGTMVFQMRWEIPQDTDRSQDGSSIHTIDEEEGQEGSITHPSGAEGRQESRSPRRTFQTTPRRSIGKGSRHTPNIPFSRREEEFLTSLKEGKKKLSWKDIHKKFSKEFPGRSCASLQVRYSTKLRKR